MSSKVFDNIEDLKYMVRKSYGKMRGSRYKMQSRGKPTLNRYLKKFAVGQTVHVNYLPSSPIIHPRFQGLTGKITEKRGDSYGVLVKDGNKEKFLFLRPEHLRGA